MDKHPTDIDGRPVEEIARKVADLRYDALVEFLIALAVAIELDARKDDREGRTKLGRHMFQVAQDTKDAAENASFLWEFARKYMSEDDK